MGGKRAQRCLFVLPHEAAVAVDVGAEYGGELALHYPPLMSLLLSRSSSHYNRLCQTGSWCEFTITSARKRTGLHRKLLHQPNGLGGSGGCAIRWTFRWEH